MLANVFFFLSFFSLISPLLPWPRLSQQVSAQLPAQNSLIYFGSTLIFFLMWYWVKSELLLQIFPQSKDFVFGNNSMFTIYFPQVCSIFWLPTSPGCTFARAQASLRHISPQRSRLVPANWQRGIGPGNSAVIFCWDEKIKSKFTPNECGLLLVLGSILISED